MFKENIAEAGITVIWSYYVNGKKDSRQRKREGGIQKESE
jgi:hypothetical protein